MADENDAASRTEEPTPRKLQEAREKGDVVKTMDLPALMSLLGVSAVILMSGAGLMRGMAAELLPFVAHAGTIDLQGGAWREVAMRIARAATPSLAAVLGVAMVLGVAGNLLQHGFLFTPQKLKPEWQRLSPLAGFKRVFGPDGLAQFVKSLVKILMVGVVAWFTLKPHAHTFESLPAVDPMAMLPLAADMTKRLIFAIGAVMLVIAGADWLWQHNRFMNRMRMTKEELKEDFRQSDGDPHVKARQRQIRVERSRRRMMQAVPQATVVVMNPTHYAVALKYEPGVSAAPECVAKGLDALALRIREVAEAAGVPVIEDPPLARALYAAVDVDEQIPPNHYEAVAKIIGFILQAGRRSAARAL